MIKKMTATEVLSTGFGRPRKTDYPELYPLIYKNARPPSTHKKVFKLGPRIKSIAEFSEWIFSNNGWVFFNRKAYHPGWAMGWSVRVVLNGITSGGIFRAVRINAKPH